MLSAGVVSVTRGGPVEVGYLGVQEPTETIEKGGGCLDDIMFEKLQESSHV